jgi:hypothetical protein
MTKRNLGEEMNVLVMAILDRLDEASAKRLHNLVIQMAGMTPVLKPAVWRYPILGDVGGTGETTVQPFVFAQPLAESISMSLPGVSVTDTWHEHNGFFLILCSCRPFDAKRLVTDLKEMGWKVIEAKLCHVDLIPKVKKKKKSWWARLWERRQT